MVGHRVKSNYIAKDLLILPYRKHNRGCRFLLFDFSSSSPTRSHTRGNECLQITLLYADTIRIVIKKNTLYYLRALSIILSLLIALVV